MDNTESNITNCPNCDDFIVCGDIGSCKTCAFRFCFWCKDKVELNDEHSECEHVFHFDSDDDIDHEEFETYSSDEDSNCEYSEEGFDNSG